MAMTKSNIKVQQQALLEGKKEYIEWEMLYVAKETALLADLLSQFKIYQIVDLKDADARKAALNAFASALEIVSQRKEIYDQIRYLDIRGNEIVRVNFNNGHARAVSEDQLQNKAHRYYFQEAVKLKCHGIYISPLDLNVEHNQIEVPYKPMIRLAIPVFDDHGKKQGVLIINYLARYLMNGLKRFNLDNQTNYMLVNKDGDFLFNNQRPDLEFSFMFKNQDKATIYSQFPDFATHLRETNKGQFETEQGIVTIVSVGPDGRFNPYCFQEYHIADNASTAWKLVSFVPFDNQADLSNLVTHRRLLMVVGVLLSLVLSYLIAKYQLRVYIDNRRINFLARHDCLTRLVNRDAFQQTATKILKLKAKNNEGACLIYIDLDDFKYINDHYGHAAGDKTLEHVASVMREVFGHKALLARLGGDEFAILLSHTQHVKDPQRYADSLLQLLSCPVEVLPQHFIQVNASVGGSLYQGAGDSLEALMHRADTAMYQAKKSGKNRYAFVD